MLNTKYVVSSNRNGHMVIILIEWECHKTGQSIIIGENNNGSLIILDSCPV